MDQNTNIKTINKTKHNGSGPPAYSVIINKDYCKIVFEIKTIAPLQPILQCCKQGGHTQFLTPLIPIFLNQLLISMNLYQHAKESGYFIILF